MCCGQERNLWPKKWAISICVNALRYYYDFTCILFYINFIIKKTIGRPLERFQQKVELKFFLDFSVDGQQYPDTSGVHRHANSNIKMPHSLSPGLEERYLSTMWNPQWRTNRLRKCTLPVISGTLQPCERRAFLRLLSRCASHSHLQLYYNSCQVISRQWDSKNHSVRITFMLGK